MISSIYIPLTPDLEIVVRFHAREFNGIHSDPKVITREATYAEVIEAIQSMHSDLKLARISCTPTLDYPEQ